MKRIHAVQHRRANQRQRDRKWKRKGMRREEERARIAPSEGHPSDLGLGSPALRRVHRACLAVPLGERSPASAPRLPALGPGHGQDSAVCF